MDTVSVERNVPPVKLDVMAVDVWDNDVIDVGELEVSYALKESVYIDAGEVEILPAEGEPVTLRRGDVAIFPAGYRCTWRVTKRVRRRFVRETHQA